MNPNRIGALVDDMDIATDDKLSVRAGGETLTLATPAAFGAFGAGWFAGELYQVTTQG